ncbi:IS110 family transposase [Burkholderia cepacia]|uniref:IS110 family transposase n=1 Tax=Burkholderia cepacia TaxID=292 RepID=UPI00075F2FB8|nr:IS110 family transposase [Burkholderia cepacia]KVA59761.1 transposase [Burkholderia cepacia]
MDTVCFLAIDLAKNVFQLHGVDAAGKPVLRRRVGRVQLTELVLRLAPCTIGMEACSGAHHWARQFQHQGHTVKLISPQFVKPFVKGNKTDGNDAEAICEALQRPSMRFVPIKSVEQQDVQSLHRARSRLVSNRTGLVSQMRGILTERGIVFAQSITRARREIPAVVADTSNALTPLAREMLADLMDQLRELDKRVAGFDRRIDAVFKASETCQRIAQIEGVGPKTATAIVAAVSDPKDFRNGRHFAAWLGLVPRQSSSGDRTHLLGISKRGDRHLRTLLIHGARAVLRTAPTKHDKKHAWALALQARRGANRAIVAIANKMARVIWSMLATGQSYQKAV